MFPVIKPQVNGATVLFFTSVRGREIFPVIKPQVNGATNSKGLNALMSMMISSN